MLALALPEVYSLRSRESKQCLFAWQLQLCYSKNYHRVNHNKCVGSWKLLKKPLGGKHPVLYSPSSLQLAIFSSLLQHLYKIGRLKCKLKQYLALEHQ